MLFCLKRCHFLWNRITFYPTLLKGENLNKEESWNSVKYDQIESKPQSLSLPEPTILQPEPLESMVHMLLQQDLETRIVKNHPLPVYTRRPHSQKVYTSETLLAQESEPRDWSTPKNTTQPEVLDLTITTQFKLHNEPDDLPTTLRKWVRSCTLYPISHYVSYDRWSPSFRSFVSNS